MAAYDAICFDLDHTLCTSTQDAEALLESTFHRAGREPFCTPADLRAAVPVLPTAETDREFYDNLFTEVATRAGVDTAVAPRLAAEYLAARDPTAVEFRPGAKAALESARDRGRVGLITNGGRETQTQKLRALDIADAFDVRVFTEPSAGIHPKPHAAPFEHALAELEVGPDAAIHVGDSLHADIAGANAMGLDSAWLATDADGPRDHEPTYELASLEAFDTIV
ncbi:HAD-superfamily hydrolase, subfamily IA, variant 3 [Natrinema pellirubrum DSM 15624]|uniref:HAD-superfamily hydrolase, subfamily IA, variant 3 n=1 Tax=Natrinema pellirubrum (strain DSM 15624 / CIP 106293 / JCM 10476 / NCIMB 786 / 157) TaxID=797303 RepID=L0JNI0_NATP1|nr:HAD family hydrolase [Natrinema pellirubrum]AGB33090.1 haloacid dehalogenase superfamily enzyme, subfamily IA [Natrinema pellirubrum DSM 15624]ELY71756.1 HAD-superfamily hydrolase, subfamily IA, variant 3 [Natrinema pellirubrum DSM 15624]